MQQCTRYLIFFQYIGTKYRYVALNFHIYQFILYLFVIMIINNKYLIMFSQWCSQSSSSTAAGKRDTELLRGKTFVKSTGPDLHRWVRGGAKLGVRGHVLSS